MTSESNTNCITMETIEQEIADEYLDNQYFQQKSPMPSKATKLLMQIPQTKIEIAPSKMRETK